MKKIFVTKPSLPSLEEYVQEIRDVWDSAILTNMSKKHFQLQSSLEEYLQVPHITLFANGHLALECALESLHLPKGSEVITTPFTFASTTHAIIRRGLTPVFCDISEEDLTMDPEKITSLINKNTSAILPVHVYGHICRDEQITEIAQQYGLRVIYDAAHAFGETYKGRPAAGLGDISMFSFHATKVFHTIEGGALCYHDSSFIPVLNALKNFGYENGELTSVGGNAKMNEFEAAMGICNLRHAGENVGKRKHLFEQYTALLSGTPGIRVFSPGPDVEPNYSYLPVLFDGYKKSRDEVFDELAKHNIYARKYFYPLMSDLPFIRELKGNSIEKTPVAAFISQHILTLPLYADLASDDVTRICDIVLSKEI